MGRRRAAAAAALVLAGSAACGGGRGASQAGIRASTNGRGTVTTTATTATTLASGPTPSTAAPTPARRTTTTTRGAGATTTAPAAPPVLRALTPPVPGTYLYSTSGTTVAAGSTVVFPAVTTLVVDPPSGTRQRSTRDLRDAAGDGTATALTLDYRPGGVYLVGLRITVGFRGITDTRDLTPSSPVLLLATGARPGARVESTLVAAGGTATLVVDVLGEERLVIAGRPVDTLVMRAVVTLAPGEVTGRQELTVNVDRGSGLWVRERSVTDASAAGGLFTLRSEYRATLQRLVP